MSASNVVQPTVVGLRDKRIHRLDILISGEAENEVEDSIGSPGHAERRGKKYRRFNFAEFIYLSRTGEFPERVSDEDSAWNFFAGAITWKVRGISLTSTGSTLSLTDSTIESSIRALEVRGYCTLTATGDE